jgi:polyphosphate kinase
VETPATKGKAKSKAKAKAKAKAKGKAKAKDKAKESLRGHHSDNSRTDPAHYLNRELSFLEFNRRVLEQAKDPGTPLLERLRFLTISSTNLDEFFEVRVAGLQQKLELSIETVEADGLTPQETLIRIARIAQELVAEQYRILNQVLLPALAKEGIRILKRDVWGSEQRAWIRSYFLRDVLPVLTPVGLDPSHPFPRVVNKSLNFIVALEGEDAYQRSSGTAVVQVPRPLPRLIALPAELCAEESKEFVLLSSVVHAHVDDLFPGMQITGCYQFRVTRNSDLWVDEEEVDDLLHALRGELGQRNYGDEVRLEMAANCSQQMSDFLLSTFELQDRDLYRVDGPVNLHRLSALVDLVDRPDLKYPPFLPGVPRRVAQGTDLFKSIRNGSLLLHHPYQAFSPVLELLRQAALDPDVLAIKMTVYRTGKRSAVADALLEAARNGKEVTAVIELRARFDEAENIKLATALQEAGSNVVYGIVGYKAHAKMLLVVRREGNELRRYVHLGTGNYHPGTARVYTDLGLMTCDERIGEDVHQVFQQLTGLGKAVRLNMLVQSPFSLHDRLIELIDQEAESARQGRKARILAKMNSLSEASVIQALYRASQAGVRIDLIVRGICCLRPGVPGLSETIRVRSIVGRFLEHSRVYYFHADGREITMCSSADCMPRNLFRRVEVAFPINDEKQRTAVIRDALWTYLEDNTQAWELAPDGTYSRIPRGDDEAVCAQELLLTRLSQPDGIA